MRVIVSGVTPMLSKQESALPIADRASSADTPSRRNAL
jgi:hypothetical protein